MHLNLIDSEPLIPSHVVFQSVIVISFTNGDAATIDARILCSN